MRHFFIVLSWGPMLALGVPDLPGVWWGSSIFFCLFVVSAMTRAAFY